MDVAMLSFSSDRPSTDRHPASYWCRLIRCSSKWYQSYQGGRFFRLTATRRAESSTRQVLWSADGTRGQGNFDGCLGTGTDARHQGREGSEIRSPPPPALLFSFSFAHS